MRHMEASTFVGFNTIVGTLNGRNEKLVWKTKGRLGKKDNKHRDVIENDCTIP